MNEWINKINKLIYVYQLLNKWLTFSQFESVVALLKAKLGVEWDFLRIVDGFEVASSSFLAEDSKFPALVFGTAIFVLYFFVVF